MKWPASGAVRHAADKPLKLRKAPSVPRISAATIVLARPPAGAHSAPWRQRKLRLALAAGIGELFLPIAATPLGN